MKKTIITCDRCGKDLNLDPNKYCNHINFNLYYWHGGSLGGEEDKDKFELDLCENCAEKLSQMLETWIKNEK